MKISISAVYTLCSTTTALMFMTPSVNASGWNVDFENWASENEDCDRGPFTITSGDTHQTGINNYVSVKVKTDENEAGIYPTFAGEVEAECRSNCNSGSSLERDHRIVFESEHDFVGQAYYKFKRQKNNLHSWQTKKVCYTVNPPAPTAISDSHLDSQEAKQIINVLENDINTFKSFWEGVTETIGGAGSLGLGSVEYPVKTTDKRYLEINSYNDDSTHGTVVLKTRSQITEADDINRYGVHYFEYTPPATGNYSYDTFYYTIQEYGVGGFGGASVTITLDNSNRRGLLRGATTTTTTAADTASPKENANGDNPFE